jgi:hypothetical protein
MLANITVFPSAAGFLGCLTPFDVRSGIASQEKPSPRDAKLIDQVFVRLDAYKLAVLILVALSIFTLCL